MKHTNQKFFKNILKVFFVLFILFIFFCSWLYLGQLTPNKIKIFSKFPLPIAFVNAEPILISDFNTRVIINNSISNKISKAENLKISYNSVIDSALIRIIAQNKGVSVTSNEIEEEYNFLSSSIPLEGKPNFQELLKSYQLDDHIYKKQVIQQDILLRKLNIWFNSQEKLNPKAFSQANILLGQIQSGQNMEVLAKLHSQDETNQSIGGDLGFLDITEILAELRDGVQNLNVGDVKIFSSRYGLHIIKNEEVNSNKIHLRQIFIQTESFNTWLKSEKNKIKTIKLLQI